MRRRCRSRWDCFPVYSRELVRRCGLRLGRVGKGAPLGRPRFRKDGRPTGYRCGVSPRGGCPKRALREPAGARCRRTAQPARAPAHPAPRRAPIEPGADGRMRILLFSSYGMLAFLASKRLLLSGEFSFGVVALLLAAGLAFPAAAFGAALGERPPLAAGFAFLAVAFGGALGGAASACCGPCLSCCHVRSCAWGAASACCGLCLSGCRVRSCAWRG